MRILATAPTGPASDFDRLRDAGHEVIIGRPQDTPGRIPYSEADLIAGVGDVDVILCSHLETISRAVLEAAPRLRLVIVPFIGVDKIDLPAATRLGILVANSPTPENFIPQAAERPPSRAPRMPKFEDLPMPAQAEIRQARGETAEEEHPQKTRLSLLQRLANVGLGRRDEESEPPIAARATGPAMPPLPDRKPARTVAQQIAATEGVSEYAKRPAPQGLDAHGRQAPVAATPQGDDHLDIPAFLRRQSN